MVGATGNLGTATLERLQRAPEVTEIVGVARRVPDTAHAPYSGVHWHSVDVGSADAPARLAAIFEGADAVVHLAWALQPNHDEATMWATNVRGTAHVLSAVASAGVGQVLTASSVGACSPGPKHRRVDEAWPTGGIPTSHYSRHKAVNERALDLFASGHPATVVTRMRPGLVFQRRASVEIAGLFLGWLVPTRWLAGGARLRRGDVACAFAADRPGLDRHRDHRAPHVDRAGTSDSGLAPGRICDRCPSRGGRRPGRSRELDRLASAAGPRRPAQKRRACRG